MSKYEIIKPSNSKILEDDQSSINAKQMILDTLDLLKEIEDSEENDHMAGIYISNLGNLARAAIHLIIDSI